MTAETMRSLMNLVEAEFRGKSRYLYYGSSIFGLLNIILDNAITPQGDDGYHGGVSLTRSRAMAE